MTQKESVANALYERGPAAPRGGREAVQKTGACTCFQIQHMAWNGSFRFPVSSRRHAFWSQAHCFVGRGIYALFCTHPFERRRCGATAAPCWKKRQRARTGRGPHDGIQRNGRGPDAGVAVSPWPAGTAAALRDERESGGGVRGRRWEGWAPADPPCHGPPGFGMGFRCI
eukprot:gene23783-biopygen13394